MSAPGQPGGAVGQPHEIKVHSSGQDSAPTAPPAADALDDEAEKLGADPHFRPDTDANDDNDDEALTWLEGNAVEVTPGSDPFTSTMAVVSEADQLAVWVRLTPTAIQAIVDQLHNVLSLQHQVLGLPGRPTRVADPDDDEPDDAAVDDRDHEEQADPPEGIIRRARDPLGLRFIEARSSRAVWYIAGAVIALSAVAAVLSKVNL